jgi:predicted Zn-dependent protease
MKVGDAAKAEAAFAHAVELAPEAFDFRLNHAIALNALARVGEAMAELAQVEPWGRSNPVYCSTRGTTARGLGCLSDAAEWYDMALALDPARPRALHGRARVALEQGGADALARFNTALQANPGDPDLWLGKAQALEVLGDVAGARAIAEQLTEQAPQWTEGLKLLAQLRLAAGEPDFTSLFGSGPVRGFAVTLCIGIATSMFTALIGSRALIHLAYGRRRRIERLAI